MTERRTADYHLAHNLEHDDVLVPLQVVKQYGALFPSTAALADRRWRGDGPEFIKTSPARSGRIVYRRSAIEKWIREHTVKVEADA